MEGVAEDSSIRAELSRKGLKRASEFSWRTTAQLTLDAYSEALERGLKPATTCPPQNVVAGFSPRSNDTVCAAIRKTIEYSKLFQYPLTPDELRDGLFDVQVDEAAFREALDSLQLAPDAHLLQLRAEREQISDQAINAAQPHLRTPISIPLSACWVSPVRRLTGT